MNNFWGHLRTVHNHRKLVRKGCFKIGLFYQGLTHDLSKYSFSEFITGIKYYQGTRSPNSAEREAVGYSEAWMHHKGRNKHHYEYWYDYLTVDGETKIMPVPMPDKYIAEMAIDRISASKIYKGEDYDDSCPLQYLQKGMGNSLMHKDTLDKLYGILLTLSNEGEERCYEYIKKEILKK